MANSKLNALVKQRYSGDVEGIDITAPEKKSSGFSFFGSSNTSSESSKDAKESAEGQKLYEESIAYVKDAISPAFMQIMPDRIRINDTFAKTYFVYGYPNELESNWLSPIINWDIKLDMSVYIYPQDSGKVQKYLKKREVQLKSQRSMIYQRGQVSDPAVDIQLQDVLDLREKLVRGEEKYFHLAIYITVYANNEEDLNKIGNELETKLSGRNVLQKMAYLRSEPGFIATGPFAKDEIAVYRNISTGGISTTFPFSSSNLSHDSGILYGINSHNNSLIIFDRFKTENANMCVFAKSGGGKSFSVKLEIIRSLMLGTDVIIIDPENEYRGLVNNMGGSYLDVSLNSNQRINPFDLPAGLKDQELRPGDLLRSAIINVLGLMNLMLGKLDPDEASIMEKALITTYSLKGITLDDDDITDKRIPTMSDLQDVLDTMDGGKSLVKRLEKFTNGIFSGLFSEKTNVTLKSGLQVFSVRDLDDFLHPIAMYIILNYIWNTVRSQHKKRILVVDEAWNIMQYEDSAKFLFGLVKRARKYGLGVTTITQDVEDFIASPYGKPIVTNSSIQLLLKQSTASIDKLQDIFKLTDQEKYILLNAPVGTGLFFAGAEHVGISIIPSPYETNMIDRS